MNINQHKNHKKIAVTLTIITILIVGGGLLAYQIVQKNKIEKAGSASSKSSTKPENTVKSNTDDIKDTTKSPTSADNKSSTNTDPQAPTSTNTANNKTVVSVVTSANISGAVVYIRGGINNTVDPNGSCYALLKGPANQKIRKDTTLLQNASTSDCKTIQIPTSELSPGVWSYTLNYSSSNQEGASDEATFNIQ